LEQIAMLSAEFGRLLLECGAGARIVDEFVFPAKQRSLVTDP